MKKTLHLTLLSFLFFIFSCSQDDITESTSSESKKESILLHKNATFLEGNNKINSILDQLNSVKQSRSVNDSLDKVNFKIYKDNITYIKTPDGERESFTFFVEKNYKRNLNFVENLVISKNKNSDKFEGVLITYYFPDGYKVENKDFQVIETVPIPDIEKFDLFNKNDNRSARSSGCQVDLVETKHSCYSGHHSGAGEAAQCDHKGQGPYSTFTLYLSCSGSGGGGGGQESSPGGNNGPQTGNGGPGGNNGNSGANDGIDTGITLPPSCQGTECNEVVLPNNINVLLDKKLSFSELVFLYNNESIANEIYTALINNQQYNHETYLWAISYLTNNIDAGFYFSQNPKDLEVLFTLGSNSSEHNNAVANNVTDFLIANKNSTLQQLSNFWPSLEDIKKMIDEYIKTNIPKLVDLVSTLYKIYDKIDENSNGTLTKNINEYMVNPINNYVNHKGYINHKTKTMLWKDILLIWLFEQGNYPVNDNASYGNLPTLGFAGNDYVISGIPNATHQIRYLRNHKLNENGQPEVGSTADVRREAIKRIKEHDLRNFDLEWAFGGKHIKETIFGLDGLQFTLGSYQTFVTIKALGQNKYELTFIVKNKTGWESATRGFNNGDGNSHNDSGLKDKPRGSGINFGGTIAETFGWKETITVN